MDSVNGAPRLSPDRVHLTVAHDLSRNTITREDEIKPEKANAPTHSPTSQTLELTSQFAHPYKTLHLY